VGEDPAQHRNTDACIRQAEAGCVSATGVPQASDLWSPQRATLSTDPPTGSSPPPSASSALAVSRPLEPWRDTEWQRLWLALQSRPWVSLALMPADEGAPEDFTLLVAVILSRTGMVHLGSPIQVGDATKVPLSQLTPFLQQVKDYTRSGERIILALPPASKSPVTKAIVEASDATLLCVLLEKMSFFQARRTVDQIGASHFLGSAIFHPNQIEESRRAR
jgi:hypothetical protein